MAQITTRFAGVDDLDALVDMQVGFEQFFQDLGSSEPYAIDAAARRRDLFDIHFGPNAFVRTVLAVVDGQIAGRVSFYRGYTADVPPFYHMQLAGVYVRPEFRRRGILGVMFARLRDVARDENMKMIKWSVWGPNAGAVVAYEKLGARRFSDAWDEHFMFLEV